MLDSDSDSDVWQSADTEPQTTQNTGSRNQTDNHFYTGHIIRTGNMSAALKVKSSESKVSSFIPFDVTLWNFSKGCLMIEWQQLTKSDLLQAKTVKNSYIYPKLQSKCRSACACSVGNVVCTLNVEIWGRSDRRGLVGRWGHKCIIRLFVWWLDISDPKPFPIFLVEPPALSPRFWLTLTWWCSHTKKGNSS